MLLKVIQESWYVATIFLNISGPKGQLSLWFHLCWVVLTERFSRLISTRAKRPHTLVQVRPFGGPKPTLKEVWRDMGDDWNGSSYCVLRSVLVVYSMRLWSRESSCNLLHFQNSCSLTKAVQVASLITMENKLTVKSLCYSPFLVEFRSLAGTPSWEFGWAGPVRAYGLRLIDGQVEPEHVHARPRARIPTKFQNL